MLKILCNKIKIVNRRVLDFYKNNNLFLPNITSCNTSLSMIKLYITLYRYEHDACNSKRHMNICVFNDTVRPDYKSYLLWACLVRVNFFTTTLYIMFKHCDKNLYKTI